MMSGCKFMHEAVESDQAGDVADAYGSYQMALDILKGDDIDLNALGALMGGTKEDAEAFLARSEQRAQELKDIMCPASDLDHMVEALETEIENTTEEPKATEAKWDECATPTGAQPMPPPAYVPSTPAHAQTPVIPTTPTTISPTPPPMTPTALARPALKRVTTASPVGVVRSQISSHGSFRGSSVRNLLDEGLAMTPTGPLPAVKKNIASPAIEIVNPTSGGNSQVTDEDMMDMHMIIKNLDTGAIMQLDGELSTFPQQTEPDLDADTELIKRMIRNLDTGDVRLLKADKPKKKSAFPLLTSLIVW